MKKYNITVNGKTYQVEVEEIKGDGQGQVAPAQTQSQPTPSQKQAPAQKTEQKSQPSAPVQAGGKDVTSPMPGTVLEVTVEEGDEVKAGDVVLILEAMKMENEITAETDGKITKIYAPKGTSVNTGDALVGLE